MTATTPNATGTYDSEGSRLPSSRRSRSSSSDVRCKEDRPVGETPRASRRKTTVMNYNDMYDDRRSILSRSSVEFGGAKRTINH